MSNCEAFAGEFQNGFDLLFRHAGKPFEKLADRRAVFEIVEERLNRDPRAAKSPRAADLAGRAFNHRTLTPIEHGLSLRRTSAKASRATANDRGLARTVRPEETKDRTLGHGKRNMINSGEMTEAFRQRFTLDHGFGGHVGRINCRNLC